MREVIHDTLFIVGILVTAVTTVLQITRVGGMKSSRILLFIAWLTVLGYVGTSDALLGKPVSTYIVAEVVAAVLAGAVLLTCERIIAWEIQKREATIQVIFKDSPLFTKKRQDRIRKDLSRFRDYLAGLGFDLPSGVLPIEIGNHGSGYALAPMSLQPPIPTDHISLLSDKIDDETEPTLAYAEYVIGKSMVLPMPLKEFLSQMGTAEQIARNVIAAALATYFNWSFWGAKKGRASEWLAAFWEMRQTFGAEFTDRLLAYTVKSFRRGPSPPRFSQHRFEAGKVVNMPNKYVDYVIYSHLESAVKVVDNRDAKLPTIRDKILKDHGLHVP